VSEFPPCIDCGEPDSGTLPEGRCRDCDIDHAIEQSTCPLCGLRLWNDLGRDLFGIAPSAHDDTWNCPWVAL